MAKKNWKKITMHLFENKKSKKKIYIFPYSIKIGNKWKDFNKKSKVKSFAESYMRKH